mgnify:CR=1 FL=1
MKCLRLLLRCHCEVAEKPLIKSAVSIQVLFKQLSWIYADNLAKVVDGRQRRIALALFDSGDIAGVQTL